MYQLIVLKHVGIPHFVLLTLPFFDEDFRLFLYTGAAGAPPLVPVLTRSVRSDRNLSFRRYPDDKGFHTLLLTLAVVPRVLLHLDQGGLGFRSGSGRRLGGVAMRDVKLHVTVHAAERNVLLLHETHVVVCLLQVWKLRFLLPDAGIDHN